MIINRLQIHEKVSFTDRRNSAFCTVSYDPISDEPPDISKYINKVKEKYGSANLGSHNFLHNPKTGRDYILIYHD